jgi:hypothetical protein
MLKRLKMSNLKIEDLKPSQAEKRDFSNMDITLKKDGTLIYYKNGRLFSPRCERSERFKHILEELKKNDIPNNCFGEVYVEGGSVFEVSKRENWSKAKFMPIDIEDNSLSYSQRKALLNQVLKQVKSEIITPLKEFKDFQEGWDFVEKNNEEGLVIRNDRNWFKVKKLFEAKIEIEKHEIGSEKGCFVLINGNRVSGTSLSFVNKFKELKEQGKKPIAEVEYPFLTKEGKYYQPRLRRIFEGGSE